jgi:hypothetical protein
MEFVNFSGSFFCVLWCEACVFYVFVYYRMLCCEERSMDSYIWFSELSCVIVQSFQYEIFQVFLCCVKSFQYENFQVVLYYLCCVMMLGMKIFFSTFTGLSYAVSWGVLCRFMHIFSVLTYCIILLKTFPLPSSYLISLTTRSNIFNCKYYFRLLKESVSTAEVTVCRIRWKDGHEWWVGKYLEEGDCKVFQFVFLYTSAYTEENH